MKLKKTQKKLQVFLEKNHEIPDEAKKAILSAIKKINEAEKILAKKEANPDFLTVSDIAELIKNNPLIDINGHQCPATDVAYHRDFISVVYCDPGDWDEPNEEEREYCSEEVILTEDSIQTIKSFLKRLSPQIINIDLESYHLADVKFSIYVAS